MAYIPASCDYNCRGCEKNCGGWCIWRDRATPDYESIAITASNDMRNYLDNILNGYD